MKTLILLAILILSGCGEQADPQAAKDQAAKLEKEMQEKAHKHGEHCDNGHVHDHGDDHKH